MAQPPDAVQARIAPYTGQSSLFLFGGVTLIAANLLLSQQGWTITRAVFPRLPAQAASQTQTSVLDLVGQVILLGALLLVGSVSEEAGTFALVFLAALWLGFLYSHRGLLTGLLGSTATPPASPSGGANSTNNSAWLR